MSSQGIFITLEGGRGAEKSTQIKTLAAFLQDKGHDVILTREPGGTPEAEKIRELLVNRDGGDWTPMAETLLFFAARAMHIETLIKPALAEGKIVICDRFTDSTRAYQSYGHGLDPDIIESYVQLAIAGFEPDLTFILDIDAAAGLERAGRRNTDADSTEDRFEQMQIDFHERLRQGFLEIAARNPERCVIIDAQQSIDEIAAQIGDAALERISNV